MLGRLLSQISSRLTYITDLSNISKKDLLRVDVCLSYYFADSRHHASTEFKRNTALVEVYEWCRRIDNINLMAFNKQNETQIFFKSQRSRNNRDLCDLKT